MRNLEFHGTPSGNDRDRPELAEMLIEGHGGRDAKALHHHAADAIGEAPSLVLIRGEHTPGAGYIGLCDPFEIAYMPVEKGGADLQGTLILVAYLEHGQQFVNDVIGGDKGLSIPLKPVAGGGMIG